MVVLTACVGAVEDVRQVLEELGSQKRGLSQLNKQTGVRMLCVHLRRQSRPQRPQIEQENFPLAAAGTASFLPSSRCSRLTYKLNKAECIIV